MVPFKVHFLNTFIHIICVIVWLHFQETDYKNWHLFSYLHNSIRHLGFYSTITLFIVSQDINEQLCSSNKACLWTQMAEEGDRALHQGPDMTSANAVGPGLTAAAHHNLETVIQHKSAKHDVLLERALEIGSCTSCIELMVTPKTKIKHDFTTLTVRLSHNLITSKTIGATVDNFCLVITDKKFIIVQFESDLRNKSFLLLLNDLFFTYCYQL